MRVVLETPRLLLRELEPDDAPALHAVFADPYALRFYPDMAHPDAARARIDTLRALYARCGFGLWGLVLKARSELVGDCGLTIQDVAGHGELEVGWHVRADQRGHGLATEAGRAVLAWALRETAPEDWPRVVSLVHVDNPASAAVAARVHQRRLAEAIERRGGRHWVYATERARG